MAVKTIDEQLRAYYEQLRHPMPDYLHSLNERNIHDIANIRFNERLWQKVKELDAQPDKPDIHAFRQIAAEVRHNIDREIYECDDPERLSMDQISHQLTDAQIAFSPVNTYTPDNENEDNHSGPESTIILFATISVSTRGLSKREHHWILKCFEDEKPDITGGDHTIVIGSPIEVDSMSGVDRWLPRRVRQQILDHASQHAHEQGLDFKIPFGIQLRSFLGKIF